MRKIFSVLLVLLALLLCSCSSAKEIRPYLAGISFTADMTYYNESYGFDGEIFSDGTLKISMTEPEQLKDLNITVSGEGMTVEYKGLTYSPVEGSMPFSAVLEEFYNPLREIVLSDTAVADSNGVLTGSAGTLGYTLTVSPTGLPQKLEIPDERFTVKFYNVSVKEDVND